jgi:tRNA threonylcarbamoyladenosine biosynthesis protein TsaB
MGERRFPDPETRHLGLFLGMDTCTRWLNLALLGSEGEVLAQVHEEVQTHTTRLVPALQALFVEARRAAAELGAIGVVLGPGSFTGLRVGLAAAQGVSAALGVPTFGVDSLTALALRSEGQGEGVALLDARRRQVYARRFRREGSLVTALGEPAALDPSEAIHFDRSDWAIGDGVPLVSAWPSRCLLQPAVPNLALSAAAQARVGLASGQEGSALVPLYVRAPDAKEPGK